MNLKCSCYAKPRLEWYSEYSHAWRKQKCGNLARFACSPIFEGPLHGFRYRLCTQRVGPSQNLVISSVKFSYCVPLSPTLVSCGPFLERSGNLAPQTFLCMINCCIIQEASIQNSTEPCQLAIPRQQAEVRLPVSGLARVRGRCQSLVQFAGRRVESWSRKIMRAS